MAAKLYTLEPGKFGSLSQAAPQVKVVENISPDRWVMILRAMGATDAEVREIMQQVGWIWHLPARA